MPFLPVIPPNLWLDFCFKNTPGLTRAGSSLALHGGRCLQLFYLPGAVGKNYGITHYEQPGNL